MRKGLNPEKDKPVEIMHTHQVVIPVYIPHTNGFFKDALQILKCCLDSLFKTAHAKTYITIVNNGSCDVVVNYLNQLYKDTQIQEIVHTTNIGKINAIIKGIKGHEFPLITIADADVLFLNNWQSETVNTFNAFPKAGVVGVVPQFKMYTNLCSPILFDKFWSKQLHFSPVKNPEAIQQFYKSIEWDDNYNKDYLKTHLVVRSPSNINAVVGSGHFIATYKKSALQHLPNETSKTKMGSELSSFLDCPVVKVGGWRLTTEDNYAYHMGNVYEPWMDGIISKLEQDVMKEYHPSELKSTWLSHLMKNQLFRKLLQNDWFMNMFLRMKGLHKDMAQHY